MPCDGQSLRELFGQVLPELDPLDAALLQQSAASAALGCASNFAAIDHHIRAHGIFETAVSWGVDVGNVAAVRVRGYNGALACVAHRIAQILLVLFIDLHRFFLESRIVCWNHKGISQIFSMKYNSAARPTPDQVTLMLVAGDVGKSTKVSE